MPSLSNKVGIHLTSDFDGKGVDQAERAVGGLGGKLKTLGGLGATALTAVTATAAIAGAALVGVGGKAINAYKEMEQFEIAYTTLLKDRGKALNAIADIQRDAARTPFNLQDLIKANQLLISADVGAGDARKTIMALGNAVSATGGGTAELLRLSQNLQQIRAVGKASALDIKQFGFAGINIYKLLAEETGKSVEQVKEMEISYDTLASALQRASAEGGMFAGAMDAQSKTIQGSWSNLQDVFSTTLAKIGEGIAKSTNLGERIGQFANFLSTHQDSIVGFVTGVVNAVSTAVSSIVDFYNKIYVETGFLQGVVDAFRNFYVNHWGQITAAGQAFVSWFSENAWPIISVTINNLLNLFKLWWNFMVVGFNAIKAVVAAFVWAWNNNFLGLQTVLRAFWNVFKAIFNAVANTLATVMNLIAKVVNAMTKIPGFSGPTFNVGEFKAPTIGDPEPAYLNQQPAYLPAGVQVGNINIYDNTDYQSMMRDMSYIVQSR